MSTETTQSTSAATDVSEFISDLDAGQFERALSVALSDAAARAVDRQKASRVVVTLDIKPIGGTHQVHIGHTLAFKVPTEAGSRSEDLTRTTTLHVGKFGRLSLVPETQGKLFGAEAAKV